MYFEGIEVGDVKSWELAEENRQTVIKIFIRPEYSNLVNEHSHFFNATGIEVEGGLTGFTIRTESITSILLGGIAFKTPEYPRGEPRQKMAIRFELFEDFKEADPGIPITIRFSSAEGLKEGSTKVLFEGVTGRISQKLPL